MGQTRRGSGDDEERMDAKKSERKENGWRKSTRGSGWRWNGGWCSGEGPVAAFVVVAADREGTIVDEALEYLLENQKKKKAKQINKKPHVRRKKRNYVWKGKEWILDFDVVLVGRCGEPAGQDPTLAFRCLLPVTTLVNPPLLPLLPPPLLAPVPSRLAISEMALDELLRLKLVVVG